LKAGCNASSRASKGNGEEACILKSIEGSWGMHASSRALKGGRRHASRALRQ